MPATDDDLEFALRERRWPTLSLACSLSLTLSLSHTHTHTHSLSLTLALSPALAVSLSRSLQLSFTLCHTHTLNLSPCFSLTLGLRIVWACILFPYQLLILSQVWLSLYHSFLALNLLSPSLSVSISLLPFRFPHTCACALLYLGLIFILMKSAKKFHEL